MNAHIIKRPLITEKSLYLANLHNAYTFEVDPSATKTQIAETIEQIFGVKVIGIQTVMRGKSLRRTGKKRINTFVPRKKKALVTLEKGQTIALFDISNQGQHAK